MGVVEEIINTIVNPIVEFFSEAIRKAESAFSKLGEAVYQSIGKPLEDAFKKLGDWVKTSIQDLVKDFSDKIKPIKPMLTNISNTLLDAFDQLKSKVENAFKSAKEWIIEAVGEIQDHLSNAWEKMSSALNDWSKSLGDFFGWVKDTLYNNIMNFISLVQSLGENLYDALLSVKDVLTEKFTGLLDIFGNLVNALTEFFTLKPEDVAQGLIQAQKIMLGLRVE